VGQVITSRALVYVHHVTLVLALCDSASQLAL
jgi:hypothetical protein